MMMKHKYKDIEGSRREFTLEIPYKELDLKLEEIFASLQKNAEMPGFRKGKVPLDMLKKQHNDAARERALGDLVGDSYRKAVKDTATDPVSLPTISDLQFKEGQDIKYKATVDIRPKITLKNYKGMKLKRHVKEVKDEDVDSYLATLKKSYKEINKSEEEIEINDDFIKKLGGPYKTLAEFKEAVKKDLKRREELHADSDMKGQILKILLKNANFNTPKGILTEETEMLVREAKENLKKRGIKEDEIKKKEPDIQKNMEQQAESRVRLFFVLDKIAKEEKISVTDKELDGALEVLALQSNVSKDELEKYYREKGFLGRLKGELRENKIIDFLIKNADVTKGG